LDAGLFGGTRLVSLGIAALERLGIEDVNPHIIVLTHAPRRNWVIRSVLLKKNPFTELEEKQVAALTNGLGFQVTHLPRHPEENFISKLILHKSRDDVYRSLPLDISPTTDDRPFFFYQERLGRLFKSLREKNLPSLTYGVGLQLLSRTLVIALVLVGSFFIIPMFFLRKTSSSEETHSVLGSLPYLLYFCCLGVGFMFLEIVLLQKFSLFLGHPSSKLHHSCRKDWLFDSLGSAVRLTASGTPSATQLCWVPDFGCSGPW